MELVFAAIFRAFWTIELDNLTIVSCSVSPVIFAAGTANKLNFLTASILNSVSSTLSITLTWAPEAILFNFSVIVLIAMSCSSSLLVERVTSASKSSLTAAADSPPVTVATASAIALSAYAIV